MVTLNVAAFDTHGQPVSDLTRDDFQVQDQGKRQQIAFFRRHESRPRREEVLGPHEYSNRAGPLVQDATVILLDLLNANLSDRGTGWEGVDRALEHLEKADNLYLYLLTADARLFPVHGLPGSEVDDAPAGQLWTQLWTKDIRARLDRAIRTVNRLKPIEERDPAVRVRQTYEILANLAHQLEAVPGRKSVVWITHGVPTNFRTITNDLVDMSESLRQFCARLNRVGIAMYTVDQGGPGSVPPGASTGSEGPGYQSQDTLQQLSELTGGRAYPGNNVEPAVATAMAATRGSYLILYDPPRQNWDGKFHKIRVNCTRKGVRIQTQQGYYAVAQDSVDDPMKRAFDAASANEFDASAIGLRATVTPVTNAPNMFDYEVRVDAEDLLLVHRGERDEGQLSVGFMGLVGGLMKPPKATTVNVSLSREQFNAALKEGLPLVHEKVDGKGMDKIRIVVLDLNSGEFGTLTVPVSMK